MTATQKREGARQFYYKWRGKGQEDEHDQSYWIDMLQMVFGIDNATDYFQFQKKVIVDGHTKKIDAYIPDTKIIIEQKSLGKELDKKISQSGDIQLTPYEQAKRYNNNLKLPTRKCSLTCCNNRVHSVYYPTLDILSFPSYATKPAAVNCSAHNL